MTDPRPPRRTSRRSPNRGDDAAARDAAAREQAARDRAARRAAGATGPGAEQRQPAPEPTRKTRPRGRPGTRAKAIAIAVGAALLVLVVLFIAGGGGGVAPQVTVAGVDMGQDEPQVDAALAAKGKQLVGRLVTLEVAGGVLGTMRPTDLGGTADVGAAKAAAVDAGPQWRIVRGARSITGADPVTAPLPVAYRKGALDAWVADIATQVDKGEQNARVTAKGATLQVTPATDGREVDRARLAAMVSGDLASLPSRITIPLVTTRPAFGTAQAQQEVAQAQAVLTRGTQVTADGVTAQVDPAAVAAAFHFGPKGLSLSGADLQKPLYGAFPSTSTLPQPARFVVRGKAVTIAPSKEGRLVDGKQVAQGLMGEDRPVEAGYVDITPVFTTEKARAMGIREEVGSFTTPYTPGEPRVTNIRRASTILNGTIIPPGGKISLNQVLGERTLERGFVPAPMLADGLHVDAVGGGVSQVATTLFNAAFFAGFALNEHTAHQLYIDRYPEGREATISWPTPDLVITNDWDASALVRVWNAADSITIALYSTSFDRRVEESTSERKDFTEPKTRYVATEGIPSGQEQELSSGDKGFSVTITRKVYAGPDLKSDDEFTTVYLAPPKVIGVAPGTPGAETPSSPDG